MENDRNVIGTSRDAKADIRALDIEEAFQCQKYCRCCPYPGAKCRQSEFQDPDLQHKLKYKEERNSHE